MDGIEIKDGQVGIFSADGDFLVRVKDGETHIIPNTPCFNYKNDPRYKQFHHDCEECVYLGLFNFKCGSQYTLYDAYYCEVDSVIPTVIARYGDEGSEYLSGLGFGGVLKDIERYARELGILS